jgi:hypothetical protein
MAIVKTNSNACAFFVGDGDEVPVTVVMAWVSVTIGVAVGTITPSPPLRPPEVVVGVPVIVKLSLVIT